MRMKSKTNINSDSNKIQLFEDQQIRSAWDGENEEWYFSIVDDGRVLLFSLREKRSGIILSLMNHSDMTWIMLL